MPDKLIIKKEILGTFDRYIDSLLSICESEIEKQLFALFLLYILEDMYGINKFPYPKSGYFTVGNFENHRFTSIDRIYTTIEFLGMAEFEVQEYLIKGYSYHDTELIKATGISFEDEDMHFSDKKILFKLIPQFEIQLEKKFRLDFALLSYHFTNEKLVRETKIAIECDGFDFHSTKEQLTNDNMKNRILQLDGWKLYRMSGSEIYKKKTLKDIQAIFKDLRTLSK